jgi:23S rRNA (cytosine1962-C5)-methyltransferase
VGLNFPNEPRHEALTEDCFQFLKDMPEDEFDLIILDPPAFTKHISTVDKATRGYKEINLKAIRKIRPGGILFTFSCSQHISADLVRKIIYGAAVDAGREVQVLHRLAQPEDHPVSIYHPEGEYLKGLVLRVL